jgi:para-nitrobenzyl esterase
MPIAHSRSGAVEGFVEDGIQIFRGIPFAQPPIEALRFAAPQREKPWSGTRSGREFGSSAPQSPMALPLPGMDVGPMDEDCLYLNVYTPAADDGRRPVMVWIHGGGFVIGSGSQPIYDGVPLARRGDVVVVTLNYRLGPLGFLHLADLCPDLEGAVGNAGIRDQIAALEWVRESIAGFGGDPDNVTIFGESAGGMSVGTLLGAPGARGLFQRAIPQSGAAHNVHTRETATVVARQFLEELGIQPAEAASKLRSIPADKLLDTHRQTVLKLGTRAGLLAFQPLVDGVAVPEPPLTAVQAGRAAGVDLLIGTTRDEWKLFGFLDPGLAKLDEAGLLARLTPQVGSEADARRVLETYRGPHEGGAATPQDLFFAIETDRVFRVPAIRLAEAQQQHHAGVFMYLFTWESPMMGGALGSCHAIELPFVFGKVGAEGSELFVGGGPEATKLAEKTMDCWLAFARSGDPRHDSLPGGSWPAYDPQRRATLCLGQETICENAPNDAERAIWDTLL